MPFSASDDDRSGFGCATNHQGGWWFENCLDSNLNGVFTSPSNSETTIFWKTITRNIIKTEMKIQPYPKGKSRFTASGRLYKKVGKLNFSYSVKVNYPVWRILEFTILNYETGTKSSLEFIQPAPADQPRME